MKTIIAWFLTMGVLLLLPSTGHTTETKQIPLTQAIADAIAIDGTHQNNGLQAKAQALEKINAQRRKRLTVNASGLYLFKSEQMEISFPASNPAPGIQIPGMSKKAGTKHNFDFKLSVTQPLFTGGMLTNGVKLEDVKAAITANQIQLRKIDVAAEVKTIYFNYQLLKHRTESLTALIEKLKLYEGKQKEFFKEDQIRKSDLLETETKLMEQHLKLQDLETAAQKEAIAFQSLCGHDIKTIIPNYREEDKKLLTDAIAVFKAQHPVLKTLDKQLDAQDIGKKITKGKYLPQIGAFSELHYGKPGIDFFKNEWSLYFQGGINVNMKVFDWQKKKRDLKIADYNKGKIKNQKADFIRSGERILGQLVAARESAMKKQNTLKKLVAVTTEDISLKEQLVQEQQLSNIDYLAALVQKEHYEATLKTIKTQVELLNVSINKVTGGAK